MRATASLTSQLQVVSRIPDHLEPLLLKLSEGHERFIDLHPTLPLWYMPDPINK